MTATPTRQVFRPAQQGLTASARAQEETVALPSAPRTASGLLVGLFGLVLAFAALPLALSQPLSAVLLLLAGVAVLLALFLWRPQAAPDDAQDPLVLVDRHDGWLD